ncbi:hypothetical protein BK666_20955 [Pseudomonas frederiksbergensis]|uniref:Uncharacterized protein n=1 Tax=Pseudomonas frederiksbergensis TaxID=104087 RepID=A0A423JZW2_9PSED|nr:hypothetical protein [Pseudomonas frederiksbergensis]RON43541.1 hypothetical protein BK666_20955 [Pseudomonas frederiksbergensis]
MIGSGMFATLLALAIFMVAIFEWFYLWVLCAFGKQRALQAARRTFGPLISQSLIAVVAITSILLLYFFHDDRQVDLLTLLSGVLIPALGITYLRSGAGLEAAP